MTHWTKRTGRAISCAEEDPGAIRLKKRIEVSLTLVQDARSPAHVETDGWTSDGEPY